MKRQDIRTWPGETGHCPILRSSGHRRRLPGKSLPPPGRDQVRCRRQASASTYVGMMFTGPLRGVVGTVLSKVPGPRPRQVGCGSCPPRPCRRADAVADSARDLAEARAESPTGRQMLGHGVSR
jgi:hypothetical protein